MAEVFGTVASILQVAEVGFSLAKTLYKYAASVKGAENEIKKIARDVKLTSKVLERTHEQLKADRDAQLCTDEALHDLEDVLDGCKEAFQEVDQALNKSLKPAIDGKLSVSAFDKFKWPLRTNKLEVLRANLEKLKTTLLLMLSVLAYGSKVSQRHKEPDFASIKVELTLDKLQIQNLVQAKDEATRRFEELSAAFQKLEAGLNAGQPTYASPLPANGMISMHSINPETPVPASGTTPGTQRTEFCFELCADAVRKLASSIDAATQRWESSQILEHIAIKSSLDETTKAVALLQASGNHALADYQLQLMLLEEQNKKRLLTARQEQEALAQGKQGAYPQSTELPVRGQVPVVNVPGPQTQQPASQRPMQPVAATQPLTFTQRPLRQVRHGQSDSVAFSHEFETMDFADLQSEDNLENFDFDSFLQAEENAAGDFDFSGVELEHVPVRMTSEREEAEGDELERRSSEQKSTRSHRQKPGLSQDKDDRKLRTTEGQPGATRGYKPSGLKSLDRNSVDFGCGSFKPIQAAETASATAPLVAGLDLSEGLELDETEDLELDLGDTVDTVDPEDDDVAIVDSLLRRWTKLAA